MDDQRKLNNPKNIFLIRPNFILYYAFSLNIYEYPEYHHNQYYHDQLKSHTHIHIVQFFSYY